MSKKWTKQFLLKTSQKFVPNNMLMWRGNESVKTVVLTFDDGPYPENTEKILKILRKYNIKATFFMTGREIEQHRKIFTKTVEEGHEVGNHLYNHRPITELTYSELDGEIREWKRVIKDIIPQNNFSQLLRPPHGQLDLKTLWYAWKNNWTIALWSIDTRDLDGMSLEENIGILEPLNIKGGDIILFHDDAKHIEGLLDWVVLKAKSKGLTFCKLSEMLITENNKEVNL